MREKNVEVYSKQIVRIVVWSEWKCITLRVIICAIKSPTKNPSMDENDFVSTGLTLKLLLYFRHMADSETIVAINCK